MRVDGDLPASSQIAPGSVDVATYEAMCASIRQPTLVIQGTDERITHVTQATGLARAIPGARLELIEGAGHLPNARDPVRINLLIRQFVERLGAGR